MPNTGGIILCGGESSRMGRAKAWLPFGGEFLLQRVVRVVAGVVRPVVVVAAPGQELPPLPDGIEIVRDSLLAKGPLAGFAAGLAALDGRVDAVYLSSCDVPFLKPEFVRTVIGQLQESAVAVPQIQGYPHPLAGIYRLQVCAVVERMLAENRLRLRDVFNEVPTRFLGAELFEEVNSLRNVNTPAEYELALQTLLP